MKKLSRYISAWLIAVQAWILCGTPVSAATMTSTKGMSKFFEKIYDAIFGESLDSFFEKHREEIQLRVKTGIVVCLFVLVICALLIAYFLVTKKNEISEDDDEDDEPEEIFDGPDELDLLEDD